MHTNSTSRLLNCGISVFENRRLIRESAATRPTKSSTTATIARWPPSRS
jgi:hypothetical protein